jgi:hypothetical protein
MYSSENEQIKKEMKKMGGRLNTQFIKFHENIRLKKESVLCNKREILQRDFKNNFPQKMEDLGYIIKKSDLTFFD